METAETERANEERWREIILDHVESPVFGAPFAPADGEADLSDATRGDRVRVTLALAAGRIERIGLECRGSQILRASASMMAADACSRTPNDAVARAQAFLSLLPGAEPIDEAIWGDAAALNGIRKFPARLQCASLPWRALGMALETAKGPPSC